MYLYDLGKPCPLQTSGNEAYLHMETNDAPQGNGFLLRYWAVDGSSNTSAKPGIFVHYVIVANLLSCAQFRRPIYTADKWN